jgi:hypothetical protein
MPPHEKILFRDVHPVTICLITVCKGIRYASGAGEITK